MGKYYRVYADVELGNIESNVEALMALTPAGTKSLAVVKADGYGHGDVAVAKAVYSKVFGYAVATLDEAVNLRENGIEADIVNRIEEPRPNILDAIRNKQVLTLRILEP